MRLPLRESLEDVDAAVIGIPTDDAVSFRSGARFGPEGIRSASVLLRPYNPALRVDVTEHLSMIDHGDSPTVPGYHEETLARIRAFLEPVHRAGVTPVCIGGDHSMVLAELRAAAAVHGQLALVHLDAHADVWDAYYGARYFHGTIFRRAAEEGLVDTGGVGAGGHARHALRRVRRGRAGPARLRGHPLAAPGGDDAAGVRRSRARPRRRPAGVLLVRHRLRRPRLRTGHRDARGGRPDKRPGALRTCAR